MYQHYHLITIPYIYFFTIIHYFSVNNTIVSFLRIIILNKLTNALALSVDIDLFSAAIFRNHAPN